jgi:hypothetical protein
MELREERERHIIENHPDLLPEHRHRNGKTMADPDQVRTSNRFKDARLFSRWFADVRGGKYIVVVVVSDSGTVCRHWIITAYIARKLVGGEIEWKKN